MYVRVAEVADVPAGTCKLVDVRGAAVALCNVEGAFYAVQNACSHMGGSLSEGRLAEGTLLQCPWHAWEFDLKSGDWTACPGSPNRLQRYEVRLEGEDVLVNSEPLAE